MGEQAMNVTDMRTTFRRANTGNESAVGFRIQERRKGDRRKMASEPCRANANIHRIWLTPGERALIEDLYLLED